MPTATTRSASSRAATPSSEVLQAGWTQSFPASRATATGTSCSPRGQVDTGNDFGNYQNATKSGMKFHDLNADGVKDAGEPGLAGWTIYWSAPTAPATP